MKGILPVSANFDKPVSPRCRAEADRRDRTDDYPLSALGSCRFQHAGVKLSAAAVTSSRLWLISISAANPEQGSPPSL